MLAAVRSAGADASAAPATLLAGVGRIGVPKGRWRYQNPGGEIARAIGAERAVSLLASVGVLQQTLIGDACRAIAEGETDTALVVGGDAGYRILRSSIEGVRAEERQQDDAPQLSLSPKDELRHPAELRAGMKMPVGLVRDHGERVPRANGWSIDSHRDRLAQMYSRFSEIAADNPSAWNRKRVDARDDPQRIRAQPDAGVSVHQAALLDLERRSGGRIAVLLGAARGRARHRARQAHLSAREHRVEPHGAGVDARELRRVPGRGHRGPRRAGGGGASISRHRSRRSLHVLSGRGRDLRRRARPAVDARPHGHGLDGVRRRSLQQLRPAGDVPHGASSCARDAAAMVSCRRCRAS